MENITSFLSKVQGWYLWLPKFWIWSLAFQKHMDGPCGLHFVTHVVPNFCQSYMDGHCGLHFVTHLVPNLDLLPETFRFVRWGPNALQNANHGDHSCTFEKLGTKSKILVNHKDHLCTFFKLFI
ncbi:hypothetical protein Hanom_Chr05g00451591 [Helianthus anomalus]